MYDVCVVGGGLAGHLLAAQLSQRGYSTAWFRPCHKVNSSPSPLKSHLVLNYSSLRRLKKFNIDLSLGPFNRLNRYELYDKQKELLTVKADDLSLPYLGLQVPVGDLAQSLKAKIETQRVSTYDYNKIDSANIDSQFASIVMADGARVKAKYLLVTDGQHSLLREKLQHPGPKVARRDQSAITFELQYSYQIDSSVAIQKYHGEYLLGIIPNDSQSVTVVITGKTNDLVALTSFKPKELESKLKTLLPVSLQDFKCFRTDNNLKALESYTMKETAFDRQVFFGLAAKGMHPAGAMGFNQIVYETSLFIQYIEKYSLDNCNWHQYFNELTYKKFSMISSSVELLTRRNIRQHLSLLPLGLLPQQCLSLVVG